MGRSAGVVALFMLPTSFVCRGAAASSHRQDTACFTRVSNALARPRAWRQLEAAVTTLPRTGRRPSRAPPGPRSLRHSAAVRRPHATEYSPVLTGRAGRRGLLTRLTGCCAAVNGER